MLIELPEIPPSSSRSKGKRVRIISPHSAITFDSGDDTGLSADDSQQYSQYHAFPARVRSPPPTAGLHSILSKGGKVNPFDLEPSESSDEEDSPLTAVKGDGKTAQAKDSVALTHSENLFAKSKGFDRDGGLNERSVLDVEHDSDDGVPNGPFSKTQAAGMTSTRVPPTSGRKHLSKESLSRPVFPNQASVDFSPVAGHRTPMDVDAFKRLLLTGARDPTPTASNQTSIIGQTGSHGDNSSSTDTSSLSRNSILDSQTDLRLETPASSHDITPLDDDRSFSFPAARPGTGRGEPPTPPRRRGSDLRKHRHASDNSEQPTSIQPKLGSSRPLTVVTDLNQSLPTHPPLEITGSILPESPLSSTFATVSRQRVAPPPPLSRRNSQMRAKQQMFHGPTTSIAEEILPFPEPTYSHPPTINKAPAPPPPRRKGTDRATTVLTDHGAMASEAPPESQTKLNQTPPKAPPPPPSRSGSRATAPKPPASSISRSGIVPPPPPPRHRASSGSSRASTRASMEIIGPSHERRQSASQQTSEEVQSGPAEEQKDILADLSALQKELDAYRITFGS